MFGISSISFDFLTGHPFLTALIFVFLILFAVYLYQRTNPPLSKRLNYFLTSLRIIAILALFLALFEPVVSYTREYERKPALTLLIDNSKSMDLIEKGQSRFERADVLISSNRFKEISDKFEVRKKYFSGSLATKQDVPDREKTAIGEILNAQAEKEIASPAEYWLLISDGISNSGESPISASGKIKSPVYVIGVGSNEAERDISISSIDYNPVVFSGKPTELTVHLEWSGMKDDSSVIEIRSGEKIVGKKSLRLPAGLLKQEEKLNFTPEKPGQQTFQVNIPAMPNEISLENNHRAFSMTVLKSKLKVLLTADHLDWEYAFLNRFLLNSANIELTQVVSKKGGGYLSAVFPSRQEELNQYDLVILYDISIPPYKSKAELLRSFLMDKGGGLFVLMGENYLNSGYPRWLDDYLPFVSTGKNKIRYSKFNGKPVENYLFHPAVRLSDDRRNIRQGWETLPPFEIIVPTDSVIPNSEILVLSGLTTERGELPVLGLRNFGLGKVLAATSSPFWHWMFFDYGFGGEGKEYGVLFNGIVNWLALKEETDPIKIFPGKNIYTRGEKISFSASVYDLSFRPIAGASGLVQLINAENGDTISTPLSEVGDGKYHAEFGLTPPDRYKYVGRIEKDGKKLRENAGEIMVESFSIEEYQRQPDFNALSSISQITGGAFSHIDDADNLLSKLKGDPIAVFDQREIIIWNKFWLLAIFILSLSIEWLIRKRYQLI
jgi:uncharacterized membrane protein